MSRRYLIILFLFSLFFLPIQENGLAQSATDSLVMAATDTALTVQSGQRDLGGYFYRVFWVTAFIVLFLLGFLFFYKKYGGTPKQLTKSKIHVLTRQQLGTKQSVMIVIIENKKYALGVTDHSVQLISELGEANEQELSSSEIKPIAQSFASIFSKIQKK